MYLKKKQDSHPVNIVKNYGNSEVYMAKYTKIFVKIRDLFLHMKLHNKLALIYSIIIIIPVVLVGFISYRISENALTTEVTKLINSDLDKSCERIDSKLKSWIDRYNIFSTSKLVLSEMPYAYDGDYPKVFAFYSELDILIRSLLASDRSKKSLHWSFIELYSFNSQLLKDQYYVKDQLSYKGPLSQKGSLTNSVLEQYPKLFWLPPATQIDGTKVLTLCGKLYKAGFQDLSGITCFYIPISSLEAEFTKFQLPPNGWAVYVDANKNEIFSINHSGENLVSYNAVLESNSSRIDTNTMIYFVRSTPANGGKVILCYPKAHLKDMVYSIFRVTQVFVLLSIIVATIISYLVARLITKRLKRFVNNVSQMIEEDKSSIDPYLEFGHDEIGLLNNRFNKMVNQMNSLLQEKYQNRITKRALELELLQYQVNPHFLYNILASIKWIGNGIIGEIVDSIVEFFRMSLNNGKEAISIATEINLVKEYVKIQQFTYDDRFRVEYDIDEEILDLYTIKLILQPIIENAILHGINEMKDFSGIIKIKGIQQNEEILLIVEDNGAGMDEDTLVNLSQACGFRKINKGYGIRNVEERLKLVYGDKYGLQIESKWREGTKVTINIPKFTKEKLQESLDQFM